MDNLINVLTIIISILTFLVCFATLIYFFVRKKKVSKEQVEAIKEFNESKQPGRQFVDLISSGYFESVKTGNHGNSFPDRQNLIIFNGHLSKEVVDVLDKVCESIGECT